jgi:hypothetical protein
MREYDGQVYALRCGCAQRGLARVVPGFEARSCICHPYLDISRDDNGELAWNST